MQVSLTLYFELLAVLLQFFHFSLSPYGLFRLGVFSPILIFDEFAQLQLLLLLVRAFLLQRLQLRVFLCRPWPGLYMPQLFPLPKKLQES